MMLVGIRVLMGPTFGGFLLVFAFWVPWTTVGAAIRAAWPARSRYTLLYDGSCGTCGRTVEIAQRLDVLGRIEVLDAANDWSTIAQRFRGLNRAACLQEMYVITPDGRSPRGFEAYRAIAWALPVAWPLLPFLYVPGVPPIGRAAYRSIAARRLHDGCSVPAAKRPSEAAANASPHA
jgi:predicted DCC family thiol-disulfide oxidoreductase YuxK